MSICIILYIYIYCVNTIVAPNIPQTTSQQDTTLSVAALRCASGVGNGRSHVAGQQREIQAEEQSLGSGGLLQMVNSDY